MTKTLTIERQAAFEAISSERDYQEDKFKNDGYHTATDRSLDEFILYIQQYASEAGALSTHGDEFAALDFVRKVGALCVGCMEKHGAPRRKGY
jgi:hypothetical protein